MTEQYTPTTEEVRDSYRYSNQRPDICGKDFGIEFDRWLAERDAEVAAKAWDEGRRAEELAWEHVFDGHPVPEGEMCGECVVENPYRKAEPEPQVDYCGKGPCVLLGGHDGDCTLGD